jgi:hypothetical protein
MLAEACIKSWIRGIDFDFLFLTDPYIWHAFLARLPSGADFCQCGELFANKNARHQGEGGTLMTSMHSIEQFSGLLPYK